MKSKINIIADNKIPFLNGVLEPYSEIRYLAPYEIKRDQVKCADALLIRTRTKCDSGLLAGTAVRFIGTATIGFDHIDTGYCDLNGIKWINAPGCNSSSVMQYIASALASLAGKKGDDLRGKTIGIIGAGNVGTKVAKIAKLLGMNLLLNDPPRARKEGNQGFVDIAALIEQSDIITFHVPLLRTGIDKTYHMADDEFFGKFEGEKIIINSSRGQVVKTSSLKDAIRNGKVAAAVLDVWEKEPLIDLELLEMVSIATPHIAGYSADGKANGTAVCVRKLSDFFNLGLEKDWYPSEIPPPAVKTALVFDCKKQSCDEIIKDTILATCNVLKDDEMLRMSPSTFEKQRGSYPVRREFPFHEVQLLNSNEKIIGLLSELGIQKIISN